MQHTNIEVYSNAGTLCEAAANRIMELAEDAITDQGEFHIALAGGSTPKMLYSLLALSPYKESIDWQHVYIYFGDERCVPPDHDDSNYRMAREALLSHVPIPEENIHRIEAELGNREAAADEYAETLAHNVPCVYELPLFDLVLLGIGPDGHIASLFPGTPALEENNHLTTPVYVEKFDSWRISVTYPVINNANHIIIFASGEGKSDIIKAVLGEDPSAVSNELLPVQRLDPRADLTWFIDADAAQHLTRSASGA